jgi:hypothetical protein
MIQDLYDNSIVFYKNGTEQTVNLVLSTIKAAVQKDAAAAELQPGVSIHLLLGPRYNT